MWNTFLFRVIQCKLFTFTQYVEPWLEEISQRLWVWLVYCIRTYNRRNIRSNFISSYYFWFDQEIITGPFEIRWILCCFVSVKYITFSCCCRIALPYTQQIYKLQSVRYKITFWVTLSNCDFNRFRNICEWWCNNTEVSQRMRVMVQQRFEQTLSCFFLLFNSGFILRNDL